MEKLLTLDLAAKRLGVAENTLRHWRQKGTGPRSARIGRRVMYRESDLKAWVDEQFSGGAA